MWGERDAEDDREVGSRCFGENKESRRSSRRMLAFWCTSAGNGDWALRRNGYPASQGSVGRQSRLAKSKRRSLVSLLQLSKQRDLVSLNAWPPGFGSNAS